MKPTLKVLAALTLTSTAFAQSTPAAPINSGDTAWVLISTALVLLMTPGLAFFYGGMARTKNVVSTLFQNFSALGVIGILWAICGYTIAFGSKGNGFFGSGEFFMLNGVGGEANADYAATIPHSLFMLFQCMFAVITPVLISGAIAERVKFKSFLAFISLWAIAVYFPAAHMVWGVGGWIRNLGALDFAGGMVVHMTAGFSALTCVLLLGKRSDFGKTVAKPHDTGMILLGTALLWFGWFGFNAGSALSSGALAAQAFGTTFFASATAFVSWMFVDFFRKGKFSAIGASVGAVAGLVAITPGAGFVTFGSSIIIGLCAGIICNFAVTLIKETFKLDDTLDVFACHGVGGLLGVILTGVFATKTVNSAGADGLFYGSSSTLIANLSGALGIIALSVIGTVIVYKIVDLTIGMRVSEIEEARGLDNTQHDEFINSNIAS